MKAVGNLILTVFFSVLFLWQAWSTISKYQASRTTLQVDIIWIKHELNSIETYSIYSIVCFFLIFLCIFIQTTFQDDGQILFPSVTFCKYYMYTERARDLILTFKELPIVTMRKQILAKTWSRDTMFESVFHNTVDGASTNPCITVSGLKEGAPCNFPFMYPDCKESFKPFFKLLHNSIF